MKKIVLISLLLLLLPLASAEVVINEIAWMGTAAYATDEWIEDNQASFNNSLGIVLSPLVPYMHIISEHNFVCSV